MTFLRKASGQAKSQPLRHETDIWPGLGSTLEILVQGSTVRRPTLPEKDLFDGDPNPEKISSREEFAAALTLVRERAGLTVRDVARAVRVPFSTLGGYFGGRHLPPISQTRLLTELLQACGVTEQRTIDAWNDALARIRRQPGPRPATAP